MVLGPRYVNFVDEQSGEETEDEGFEEQGGAEAVGNGQPEEEKAEEFVEPVAAPGPPEEPHWAHNYQGENWVEAWIPEVIKHLGGRLAPVNGLWSQTGNDEDAVNFEQFCEIFCIDPVETPKAWRTVFDIFHKKAGGKDEQGQKEQ